MTTNILVNLLSKYENNKVKVNKTFDKNINNNFSKYLSKNIAKKNKFKTTGNFNDLNIIKIKKKSLKSEKVLLHSSQNNLKKIFIGKKLKLSKNTFQHRPYLINIQKLNVKKINEKIINQLQKEEDSSKANNKNNKINNKSNKVMKVNTILEKIAPEVIKTSNKAEKISKIIKEMLITEEKLPENISKEIKELKKILLQKNYKIHGKDLNEKYLENEKIKTIIEQIEHIEKKLPESIQTKIIELKKLLDKNNLKENVDLEKIAPEVIKTSNKAEKISKIIKEMLITEEKLPENISKEINELEKILLQKNEKKQGKDFTEKYPINEKIKTIIKELEHIEKNLPENIQTKIKELKKILESNKMKGNNEIKNLLIIDKIDSEELKEGARTTLIKKIEGKSNEIKRDLINQEKELSEELKVEVNTILKKIFPKMIKMPNEVKEKINKIIKEMLITEEKLPENISKEIKELKKLLLQKNEKKQGKDFTEKYPINEKIKTIIKQIENIEKKLPENIQPKIIDLKKLLEKINIKESDYIKKISPEIIKMSNEAKEKINKIIKEMLVSEEKLPENINKKANESKKENFLIEKIYDEEKNKDIRAKVNEIVKHLILGEEIIPPKLLKEVKELKNLLQNVHEKSQQKVKNEKIRDLNSISKLELEKYKIKESTDKVVKYLLTTEEKLPQTLNEKVEELKKMLKKRNLTNQRERYIVKEENIEWMEKDILKKLIEIENLSEIVEKKTKEIKKLLQKNNEKHSNEFANKNNTENNMKNEKINKSLLIDENRSMKRQIKNVEELLKNTEKIGKNSLKKENIKFSIINKESLKKTNPKILLLPSNNLVDIKKEVIKLNTKTGTAIYIFKSKNTNIKLVKLVKVVGDKKNKQIFNNTLEDVFRNKITNFEKNGKKSEVLFSNNDLDILIERNRDLKEVKEFQMNTSKNKMYIEKTIRKKLDSEHEIIIKDKSNKVKIKDVIKFIDSVLYKTYSKKQNNLSNLNESKIFIKKDKKYQKFKNLNYLHPALELENISNTGKSVEGKIVTFNELIARVQGTLEKIQDLPRYFERTIVKITPPDLGNVEITIIKSQKNLKIEFNIENKDSQKEIEKKMEPLLINLREKFEKVEFSIKSEFGESKDENQREFEEKNQKNDQFPKEENQSDKKNKGRKKQFLELLRGESYD